jgi:hypothetical protein
MPGERAEKLLRSAAEGDGTRGRSESALADSGRDIAGLFPFDFAHVHFGIVQMQD